MSGSLEIILGCMWSGKSTEIIRIAKRYQSINKNILILKNSKDNRYNFSDNYIVSHDQEKIKCINTSKLNTILGTDIYEKAEIIIIEEAQFFEDLYNFSITSTDFNKKKVIIVGLDGDFQRKPFGDILKLIPCAEKVTKLNAFCKICNDGTPAYFTKRCINNTKQELVGSDDIYMAVCRKHFLENNDEVKVWINP